MITSRRRRPAGAVTCAMLSLTGCGLSGRAPSPEPAPAASQTVAVELIPEEEGTFLEADDEDRSDVESTAEVVALMLHSWDTRTDRTQTAAAVGAKPLMSDAWAGSQIEPERNGAQGGWLETGRHQAYSSPSIVPAAGDASRDVSEDKAIRVYDVKWRWIRRDGTEVTTSGRQIVSIY